MRKIFTRHDPSFILVIYRMLNKDKLCIIHIMRETQLKLPVMLQIAIQKTIYMVPPIIHDRLKIKIYVGCVPNSLPVLKMYSIYNVNCRFSAPTMNSGTQRLSRCYCVQSCYMRLLRLNFDWLL